MADDHFNNSTNVDSKANRNDAGTEAHAEEVHAATTGVDPEHPMLIVVMGVSSCGKSSLASALASSLSLPYLEADKLHPQSNIDKMSSGVPLTDADREPWLELIRKTAEHICVEQEADKDFRGRRGVVIACSALKRYYRDILRGTYKPRSVPEHMDPAPPRVLPTFFVYMKGEKDVLMERISKREGHFMKAGMLESQLQTLESPEGEDGCIVVRVEDETERQIEIAREGLEKCVVGKL